MSARRLAALALAVALVLALVATRRDERGAAVVAAEPAVRERMLPATPTAAPGRSRVEAHDAPSSPAIARVPAPPPPLPPAAADAAAGLAQTLHAGDERSPPLAPAGRDVDDVPPTTNELADPAAYRRYESRRQARLYRAFEREASIALADIRRDIERARAAGVPPEQIAEGEDKARRLAQTLRRVQDGTIGTND